MKPTRTQHLLAIALVCVLAMTTAIAHAADSLPSWNDVAAKKVCGRIRGEGDQGRRA